MSNPLLTLGPFSFLGLESPSQIYLKSSQRIAVHHLGSGRSVADALGQDCEIVTFRGIFNSTDAADRIRAINYLRDKGTPLPLTWGSRTLSVVIQKFELNYSSELWIPYKLACYVIDSIDAGTSIPMDFMLESPATQVNDILTLMKNTNLSPVSGQTAALLCLSTSNYDKAPPDALAVARKLAEVIDNQIALHDDESGSAISITESSSEAAVRVPSLIARLGQQAALVLARNRVLGVVVFAESMNSK